MLDHALALVIAAAQTQTCGPVFESCALMLHQQWSQHCLNGKIWILKVVNGCITVCQSNAHVTL